MELVGLLGMALGGVPLSHLESWGEGGHLGPGSFRCCVRMSPSLCATLQGWHLHPGLLALYRAIGPEFSSRHKPSRTWRTRTHTGHGAMLPGTCRTDWRREE